MVGYSKQGQLLVTVLLVLVYITSKQLQQGPIEPFYLPIRGGVVGGSPGLGNLQELAHILKQRTLEITALIRV